MKRKEQLLAIKESGLKLTRSQQDELINILTAEQSSVNLNENGRKQDNRKG